MQTRTLPGATSRISRPKFCEARSVRYMDSRAERASSSALAEPGIISSSVKPGAVSRDTLAAGEARRALLGEGRDTLRVVARAAQLALQVTLDIELLLEAVLPAAPQSVFRGREPARGRHGKLTRHGVDRAGKLRVLDALPDQPPGGGLLGGQFVAQQSQPHGAGIADQPRQEPRAAGIGNQPELGEGFHEIRAAGLDDDIACQRNVGAC